MGDDSYQLNSRFGDLERFSLKHRRALAEWCKNLPKDFKSPAISGEEQRAFVGKELKRSNNLLKVYKDYLQEKENLRKEQRKKRQRKDRVEVKDSSYYYNLYMPKVADLEATPSMFDWEKHIATKNFRTIVTKDVNEDSSARKTSDIMLTIDSGLHLDNKLPQQTSERDCQCHKSEKTSGPLRKFFSRLGKRSKAYE